MVAIRTKLLAALSVAMASMVATSCSMPFSNPIHGPGDSHVIDAHKMYDCLGKDKPALNWTVHKPDSSDAKVNALSWYATWGKKGSERGSGQGAIEFLAVPSLVSGKQIRKLFFSHSEVTGEDVNRYSNVIVFTSGDSPAPSEATSSLVNGCLKSASSKTKSDKMGRFRSCSQTASDKFFNHISVRKLTCKQAVTLLSKSFDSRKDMADALAAHGYFWVNKNICCANDANYVTNGSSEIVYETSV